MRILLAIGAACVLMTGCEPVSEQAPVIDIAFELTDENGDDVTSADYGGRLRLVFFGFTSCPDICPITLQNVGVALDTLGPLAERVTVLFISIDPIRDTPERLAVYTDAIHPRIIGLTGTYDQVTTVTSGFRTAFGYSAVVDGQERPLSRAEYEALEPEAAYTPFHSSRVYVIGERDELLDMIGYGSKPSFIAEKLREFL